MPATFAFGEDNGAATGSPAHGTTRSGIGNANYATDVNWKSVDDCTANSGTVYTSAPITAGNNSYTKYQYGIFSGSYTSISSCLWAHTAGTLGTGLTLNGVVTSTYATPSTTANSALTVNMTSAISIGSGQSVNFSSSDPSGASPTSTLSSGGGYTQYLATQLQTTSGASAGSTATITLTVQYNES
jgi:hypothetical protein